MSSHIRPVTKDDLELVKQLRLEALKSAPEAFASRYEDEVRMTQAEWEARIHSNAEGVDTKAFLAERNDRGVGLVVGVWGGDEARRAEIVSLFVSPDARGTGLGRALISAVVEWARGRGAVQVSLRVGVENTPARRLYEAAGFGQATPAGPCGEAQADRLTLPLRRSASLRTSVIKPT